MAGRGRAATLPAWMTAGGGAAAVTAPGAPAAAPGAAAPGGVPAPGSTGLLGGAPGMPAGVPGGMQPQSQPVGGPLGGMSRAPMMVPAGLAPAAAGGASAPSPTGAAGPPGGGIGQPDTQAMAAAAVAAAKAAAAAAGIRHPAGAGAPDRPAAAPGQPGMPLMGQPGTPAPAAAPPGFGAPSPTAAAAPRPAGIAPPGQQMGGPHGMMPPPGAFPGMPPMYQPPPGLPPGMMPPPGMVPPGMPFGAPPPGMHFGPPGAGMFPPHMAPHMQPQPQMQAVPAAQQPQQQLPKSDWTEHTAPDGKRKYFYNTVTQQSTWVKPDELMTPEERAKAAADKASAAAAAAAAAPPAASAASKTADAASAGGHSAADIAKAWKQYTAPDGRPYYHNKLTRQSKWVMPEEMKQAQAAAGGGGEAAGGAAAAAAGSGVKPPPTQTVPLSANGVDPKASSPAGGRDAHQSAPAAPKEPAKPIVYPNKEVAKEAFKQLLQDFDVPPEASWDNTMRLIIHDARYGALKALGEKKAAFNEYCTARRAAERDEARKRQVAAKEGFLTLLEECAELRPGDGFDRASRLLNHENRWKDVDSDALRRELFKDHMDGLKRRRVEEEKRAKESAVAAFKELLERSSLKASSSWRKVQGKLQDAEEYEALDRLTRLEVFQEHIRQLEEVERQEKEKEKETKRRLERRNRDAFRQLLQQHRDEGRINVRSRWKEYGSTVEDDPTYMAVKKNTTGSRPKELFEDLIVELEEEYDRARPLLKDALRAANWTATLDSTYSDYLEALSGSGDKDAAADGPAAAAAADGDTAMTDVKDAAGSKGGVDSVLAAKVAAIRDSHKRVYFEEQVGRAKEKAADAEKKKKRALEKFVTFVRTAEGLYATTTWEEFEGAFKDEDEFVAVGGEVARGVFDEHIERLKAREKDKKHKGDDEDEGGGKKKKRSSRHDDDDHKKSKRHKRDRSRERSKDHKDRSRGRSRDRSRERSKERSRDRKRGRSPESGEAEEGEV